MAAHAAGLVHWLARRPRLPKPANVAQRTRLGGADDFDRATRPSRSVRRPTWALSRLDDDRTIIEQEAVLMFAARHSSARSCMRRVEMLALCLLAHVACGFPKPAD